MIRAIFEKVQFAKDVVETGDFMLKAYGAATLFIQAKQGLSGLLTFSGAN